MAASKRWAAWVEERCHLQLAPELCPGLLVFAKLVRAETLEAYELLLLCNCPQARMLAEKPWDYSLGVRAGVACRNKQRGRECGEDAERHEALEKAPPNTRANAEKMLEAIRNAGYRVQDIVWDAEIVHIVVHAGCGVFTVSCGPVGCEVTDTQGVEVSLAGGTVTARCIRAPPYLSEEYTNYLG